MSKWTLTAALIIVTLGSVAVAQEAGDRIETSRSAVALTNVGGGGWNTGAMHGYPFRTGCCIETNPCCANLWHNYCAHRTCFGWGKGCNSCGSKGCGNSSCGKGSCGKGKGYSAAKPTSYATNAAVAAPEDFDITIDVPSLEETMAEVAAERNRARAEADGWPNEEASISY